MRGADVRANFRVFSIAILFMFNFATTSLMFAGMVEVVSKRKPVLSSFHLLVADSLGVSVYANSMLAM